MKRVRARSLVLVNWKGVFYERYALDEHVTALEGDNGAGKTTVMIAAYVVMLPDMTRLRFTNVGEHDATGGDKGLWGRLGDPNRPSYAVVAFKLGDEYVLAGIHLERKGEPSVELTPFIIDGLPQGVRLQDALLLSAGDQDMVPELSDLRENVARLGGRIEVFRTAKDYFAALFERGITPLRLTTDEERSRFNDMLRTSMTGGISRALTSEFRSFLLKEESGLADTLVRMRGNLDACRRTRTEVKEAQELEHEISGVYQAGDSMFSAALLATRERAEELRRRVEEASQRREAALRERDGVAHEQSDSLQQRARVQEQLTQVKGEHEVARTLHAQVTAANMIDKRIVELERQLQVIAQELGTATAALTEAERNKTQRATERARAEAAYRSAAKGLADLQSGLEELHRRADAHRTVTQRLEEARSLLGGAQLAAEDCEARRKTTNEAITQLDRRRSDLDATLGSAEIHHREHAQVMAALRLVLERDVDATQAHAEARRAVAHLSELEVLSSRIASLEQDLKRTAALLERQRNVRARADALSLPDSPLRTLAAVSEGLQGAQRDLSAAEERLHGEGAEAEDCRRRRRDLQVAGAELQGRAARWRELDAVATRLEAILGAGLRSMRELDVARQILDEARDLAQRRRDDLHSSRMALVDKARTLGQSGGLFHPDLLTARDLVGGELLASHFDEIDVAQAGPMQARLGPLADAVVVENAREAAAALDGRARELETIWFVEPGGLRDLIAQHSERSASGETDVVIEYEGMVRTTRVPAMPTLGGKARQRVIAALHEQAQSLSERIGEADAELSEIGSRRSDTALLTGEVATLERGDPGTELQQLNAELQQLQRQLDEHTAALAQARSETTRLADRSEQLRNLLADAYLLDELDLNDRIAQMHEVLRSARQARGELARVANARQLLTEQMDVLRRAPLSAEEIESMRNTLAQLGAQREQLFLALQALAYVVDNRVALDWTDAHQALSAQQALVPSLTEQSERAAREQQDAIDSAGIAEQAWEERRSSWRQVNDQRITHEAARDRAQQDLAQSGIEDASEAAVARAFQSVERLAASVSHLDHSERELGEKLAQLSERLKARQADLDAAEEHLAKEDREWRPAAELWERLRAKAVENGLLTPAVSTRLLAVGTGSVNLRSDARGWAKMLDERLGKARGGQEILERIRAWLSGQEQTTGEDYLQAWAVVRDWLRRRIPAQVAEVDDPLEALERLRRHLKVLAERLDDQERKLRGASEDVARGIDVHIRSAQRQVKLLNQELDGVRFGTIRGMQIRLVRDDRMEGVLHALREGSAQEFLFAPNMPVEEALDALFTRFGGRGATLGQRLLDYREYVDISVEVLRQASAQWERVNPSRLSTGEAIGVGTALMMVVLTAWERSANLFRAKRSLGTLRFLFLDEANRLSQDNLEVLFELCMSVDLQLLIAAPEVARAAGCTTYRLVRRPTADGGEEVVVSGRRMIVDA